MNKQGYGLTIKGHRNAANAVEVNLKTLYFDECGFVKLWKYFIIRCKLSA